MGIIGFGRVGRRTTVIAQALRNEGAGLDRYQDKGLETDSCRYADLEELLSGSDVISLHCPSVSWKRRKSSTAAPLKR